MKYYLLKFGFYGIKNIKEEITIDFYKKTIDKNFDPSEYKVKSIYGENGTGKTAIVTAFSILKKLILNPEYLSDSQTQILLDNLVNKETNEFKLFVEYYSYYEDDNMVYRYEILVKKKDGLYYISKETLKNKVAKYANATYKSLFEVVEGQIVSIDADSTSKEVIKTSTLNLLTKHSMASLLFTVIFTNLKGDISSNLAQSGISILMFSLCTYTVLNKEDNHSLFSVKKIVEQIKKAEVNDKDYQNKVIEQIGEIIGTDTQYVRKELYNQYKKKIENLTSFIQKFKQQLVSIDIDKKDFDADNYQVSLKFNYGTCIIDLEFESSGIKKLVKMYDAISFASAGGIVFIDEFDANINSVFFDKIVEYLRDYAKGQTCFTVHNTSSMEVLRYQKQAINFLTNDNRIINWIKNSHYAPDTLYQKGMIEKIPFNIYSSDFIGIFGGDLWENN